MSKRQVAYIKPDEPSFLKKLKLQAGYKEGPTVDTKREDLGPVTDQDLQDNEEEQPTVVVLKEGDLTAEEAASETERLKEEIDNTPADLSAPIVFKAPSKKKQNRNDEEVAGTGEKNRKDIKRPKKLENKKLLSFGSDEEQEDC